MQMVQRIWTRNNTRGAHRSKACAAATSNPDRVSILREVEAGVLTIGARYVICHKCASGLLDDYRALIALERIASKLS